MNTEIKKGGFSGGIGFVLAAAGSAVGLGNLWRFPTLASKYGGGLFLIVYLVLVLTFGFSLLITDIAIGRKTDFLIQEFNREANTIGSKAQDVDIARKVIDIKAEIEKIREQVQNIE